jgi:hypothetical protein
LPLPGIENETEEWIETDKRLEVTEAIANERIIDGVINPRK